MATKSEILISLAGADFSSYSRNELKSIYREILQTGLHGICFSPYVEGQAPGTFIREDQIQQRMQIIQPYTNWVRSFSCTDGNEAIPHVARQLGLKTLVGAWLGTDSKKNEQEIENLNTYIYYYK